MLYYYRCIVLSQAGLELINAPYATTQAVRRNSSDAPATSLDQQLGTSDKADYRFRLR